MWRAASSSSYGERRWTLSKHIVAAEPPNRHPIINTTEIMPNVLHPLSFRLEHLFHHAPLPGIIVATFPKLQHRLEAIKSWLICVPSPSFFFNKTRPVPEPNVHVIDRRDAQQQQMFWDEEEKVQFKLISGIVWRRQQRRL